MLYCKISRQSGQVIPQVDCYGIGLLRCEVDFDSCKRSGTGSRFGRAGGSGASVRRTGGGTAGASDGVGLEVQVAQTVGGETAEFALDICTHSAFFHSHDFHHNLPNDFLLRKSRAWLPRPLPQSLHQLLPCLSPLPPTHKVQVHHQLFQVSPRQVRKRSRHNPFAVLVEVTDECILYHLVHGSGRLCWRGERAGLEVEGVVVERGGEGEHLGGADVVRRRTDSFRHFKKIKQAGKRGTRGRRDGASQGRGEWRQCWSGAGREAVGVWVWSERTAAKACCGVLESSPQF